jgi:hypothetical protein
MPCSTVVDGNGKPIAGVQVYARQEPSMTDLGVTDAKGRICFPTDDNSPIELWAPESIGGWCAGRVELDSARPARITMKLTVFPLTTLHGRVVDSAGSPVRDAEIDLHGIEFDGCTITAAASVKSSRAGTFALTGLRGDYEVLVKAAGFATADVTLLAKDKQHEIVLDQGASWRGRVVAPDGRVVTSAKLSFGQINRDRLTIDVANGRFDAERITPSKYYTLKIEAVDDPVLGTRTEWRDIAIQPGEHRTDDIAFSGGLELAGVAKKDPGACIVAAPAKYNRDGIFDMRIRVKPTADGHFTMHQVPRGDWVVSNCAEYPKVVVDAGRLDVVVP